MRSAYALIVIVCVRSLACSCVCVCCCCISKSIMAVVDQSNAKAQRRQQQLRFEVQLTKRALCATTTICMCTWLCNGAERERMLPKKNSHEFGIVCIEEKQGEHAAACSCCCCCCFYSLSLPRLIEICKYGESNAFKIFINNNKYVTRAVNYIIYVNYYYF